MSNENASDLPAATAALSAEDREGLINALKDKLQDLAGKHTDVLETLEPKVRKRVEVLQEIQKEHGELESKFFEEKTALEIKYEKLYEPLYTKRYEIVSGVVEVADDTNEDVKCENGDKPTQEKGVPDFWLNAMKANDIVDEEISNDDEEALKYLKDIKYSRIDDPKGFKLDFIFDPNPFFKNSVLTKTYHLIDEDNEPILDKAIGTEIEWFAENNLTQKPSSKKSKKGSKSAKSTKTEYSPSFFNFFSPPQIPENEEDLDEEDVDEEDVEVLHNQLEADYEIGCVIQEELIPHAVSWFTGEAVGDDLNIVLEDDDEDDDEDDSEDDDEVEDKEEGKDK